MSFYWECDYCNHREETGAYPVFDDYYRECEFCRQDCCKECISSHERSCTYQERHENS